MVKQHLRLSRTRQRFRDARCAFAVWHMQALLEIPSYYRTDAFRTLDVYERWAPTRNLTRTNIQIGGVKPLSFFEKLSITRVIEESYELSYFLVINDGNHSRVSVASKCPLAENIPAFKLPPVTDSVPNQRYN